MAVRRGREQGSESPLKPSVDCLGSCPALTTFPGRAWGPSPGGVKTLRGGQWHASTGRKVAAETAESDTHY